MEDGPRKKMVPRNREVSSRYKSAPPPPASARRFPSPNLGRNGDPSEAPKRAVSAERRRSPVADPPLHLNLMSSTQRSHQVGNGRSVCESEIDDASSDTCESECPSLPSDKSETASIASSDRSESERVPIDCGTATQQRPNRPVRGTVVTARFWQDVGSRIRRLSDANQLRSSVPELRSGRRPKTGSLTAASVASTPANSGAAAAQWAISPGRPPPSLPQPPISPPATNKGSPSRTLRSPTRGRASLFALPPNCVHQGVRPSSVACMLNFGVEASKGRKGMNQQEEAQYLRILHNRWLQWRFINARCSSAMASQRAAAQRILYNSSLQIAETQQSVAEKRMSVQRAKQEGKTQSVVSSHGKQLEEWREIEEGHSYAVSGAIEALEAAMLRLPITGGVKVDVNAVKDAVSCAVDVAESFESTAACIVSKQTERMDEVVSELANVASQQRAILEDCQELLDTIASMEIEERSLRSYCIQLEYEKIRKSSSH